MCVNFRTLGHSNTKTNVKTTNSPHGHVRPFFILSYKIDSRAGTQNAALLPTVDSYNVTHRSRPLHAYSPCWCISIETSDGTYRNLSKRVFCSYQMWDNAMVALPLTIKLCLQSFYDTNALRLVFVVTSLRQKCLTCTKRFGLFHTHSNFACLRQM